VTTILPLAFVIVSSSFVPIVQNFVRFVVKKEPASTSSAAGHSTSSAAGYCFKKKI